MFEGEFLIFCSGKSSDANGNITLSGIFDSIIAPSFPTMRPDLIATAKLRAKKAVNNEVEVKLTVNNENEQIVNAVLKQKLIVEKDNSTTFDFNLQGMPFPKPGKYFFKIYVDDILYLTSSILVRPVSDYIEP